MRWLPAIALTILLGAVTLEAQAPPPQLKPTEQVVKQYLKLVADGALLTPEAWRKAQKFFTESDQYPIKGPVFLLTLGNFGEMWVKGNRAEVETKWSDYMGKIDSALRYYPPEGPHVTMTSYGFPLLFTNKHWEVGADGMTTREVTGAWEWKIEGPHQRWATVEKTIIWLNERIDRTNDPVIKKNAEKTIAILKHLGKPCGKRQCVLSETVVAQCLINGVLVMRRVRPNSTPENHLSVIFGALRAGAGQGRSGFLA